MLKPPDGTPAEMRGSKWKFLSVRVDDAGEPIEVNLFGGAPNYEKLRCFPVARLKPPKPPRKTRKK